MFSGKSVSEVRVERIEFHLRARRRGRSISPPSYLWIFTSARSSARRCLAVVTPPPARADVPPSFSISSIYLSMSTSATTDGVETAATDRPPVPPRRSARGLAPMRNCIGPLRAALRRCAASSSSVGGRAPVIARSVSGVLRMHCGERPAHLVSFDFSSSGRAAPLPADGATVPQCGSKFGRRRKRVPVAEVNGPEAAL